MYSANGVEACNCVETTYNYPVAAINQLWFGTASGDGSGPGCGTCYHIEITGSVSEPTWTPGPNPSQIVVKVVNLCPAISPNLAWCAQTASDPTNQYGATYHFDMQEGSYPSDFFPTDSNGDLLGDLFAVSYEVDCSLWAGYNDPTTIGTVTSNWGCCPQNPMVTGLCAAST